MKKNIYILLFFFSTLGIAQDIGQEQKHLIDSLSAIFNTPKTQDTIRVNLLLEIAGIYNLNNPDTSISICKKAYSISKKIMYPEGISGSCLWLGYLYNSRSDIAKALIYYHAALKNSQKVGDKQLAAEALTLIGVIYFEQDENSKAIMYYKNALKLYEELHSNDGLATVYNNVAALYYKNNDINKSLEYNLKALRIEEKLNDQVSVATSLNNISANYSELENLGLAFEFANKALKIYQHLNIQEGIAKSNGLIAQYYSKLGNLTAAKNHLSKSLEISKKLGMITDVKLYAKRLSEIYVKDKNGMKAFEMLELHMLMKDSANNISTQKAFIREQTKFEFEKIQAVKDVEHEKQIAVEKEARSKQKIVSYSIGGGLGLVGIFLFFVLNRLQVTRKQKTIIENQKAVVEQAHYLLEEKNQEIMDSITYAKRIQNAILPPAKLVKEYLPASFILYKPKDIVAGDFYWLEHKNGKVLFAAADCTGHGVPGAMVSVVCNNALNRSVREHGLTDPGEILDKTRKIVIQEFEKSDEEVKDGMDIALCSLEFKVKSCELKYAGANNPLWVLRKGATEIEEIKPNKQPIGKYLVSKPFTTHTIGLQKGDSIYIFSDGYADQFGGEKGKKFKLKSLKELILSVQNKNLTEQKHIIEKVFEDWKGSLDQIDDVCIIGVRI